MIIIRERHSKKLEVTLKLTPQPPGLLVYCILVLHIRWNNYTNFQDSRNDFLRKALLINLNGLFVAFALYPSGHVSKQMVDAPECRPDDSFHTRSFRQREIRKQTVLITEQKWVCSESLTCKKRKGVKSVLAIVFW